MITYAGRYLGYVQYPQRITRTIMFEPSCIIRTYERIMKYHIRYGERIMPSYFRGSYGKNV